MTLPKWIGVVLGVDRLASGAYRAVEISRDELLRAWVNPSVYAELTNRAYAKTQDYLPGGKHHARGLFAWERTVLRSDLFPKGGRLLLGAAGGGRELPGLSEMGFEVVAFEPNHTLAAGALQVARRLPKVQVCIGSYEDVITAQSHGSDALWPRSRCAPVLGSAPYDAVVLGWGSLTHVVDHRVQTELFRTLRTLAPSAPVLISFFLRHPASPSADRLRRWVRPVLRAAGAPHQPPDGVSFVTNGGFIYRYTPDEIRDLAARAGYRVALLDELDFPHAVFVPDSRP